MVCVHNPSVCCGVRRRGGHNSITWRYMSVKLPLGTRSEVLRSEKPVQPYENVRNPEIAVASRFDIPRRTFSRKAKVMSSLLSNFSLVADPDAAVAAKYQKFTNTTYAPATILVLILIYLTLNECVFCDLDIFLFVVVVEYNLFLFWLMFSFVVRFAMTGLLCLIWRY